MWTKIWGQEVKGNSPNSTGVKNAGLFQSIFKKGTWGAKQDETSGLSGYRGTPEENAEIGKKSERTDL